MSEDNETKQTVAERMEVECPLCHLEMSGALERHLIESHSHGELAAFVENVVLERED